MRFKTFLSTLTIITLLLIVPVHADAEYSITTLDYPGADRTFAWGINNSNIISGYHQDNNNANQHGFFYNGSNYTELNHPDAIAGSATRGYDINDTGYITGYYTDSDIVRHGFIYNGSSYTTFDVDFPEVSHTFSYGINDSNNVVGSYTVDTANTETGFFKDGDNFTAIMVNGSSITVAYDINNANVIVGKYDNHGFLTDDYGATITTIDFTDESGNIYPTRIMGINDQGIVVGEYSGQHGFIYDGTNYISFSVTAAQRTYLSGINNSGQLTGAYQDSDGKWHGFVSVYDANNILHVPSIEHPTIQSAVDAAESGDTIRVAPGTYYENINISTIGGTSDPGCDIAGTSVPCKKLTIEGETDNPEDVVLDGYKDFHVPCDSDVYDPVSNPTGQCLCFVRDDTNTCLQYHKDPASSWEIDTHTNFPLTFDIDYRWYTRNRPDDEAWEVISDSGNEVYRMTGSEGTIDYSELDWAVKWNKEIEVNAKVLETGERNFFITFAHDAYNGILYWAGAGDAGRWTIERVDLTTDTRTVLAEMGASIEADKWYHLKVKVIDLTVVLEIDGQSELNYTFSDGLPGRLRWPGLGGEGSTVYFDDFAMSNYIGSGIENLSRTRLLSVFPRYDNLNLIVENLTIQNGLVRPGDGQIGNYGGGIYIATCGNAIEVSGNITCVDNGKVDFTLRNTIIRENQVRTWPADGGGLGVKVLLEDVDITLEENTFEDNWVDNDGSVATFRTARDNRKLTVEMKNNVMLGNKADEGGAVVFWNDSNTGVEIDANIAGNSFIGNTGHSGGCMAALFFVRYQSSPVTDSGWFNVTMENNIITNNDKGVTILANDNSIFNYSSRSNFITDNNSCIDTAPPGYKNFWKFAGGGVDITANLGDSSNVSFVFTDDTITGNYFINESAGVVPSGLTFHGDDDNRGKVTIVTDGLNSNIDSKERYSEKQNFDTDGDGIVDCYSCLQYLGPLTPDSANDLDRDNYTAYSDCNDSNASINPGMTEVPGNGIDDDCNPDTPDGSCGSFSDDFENGNMNGWDGESGAWDFISGTYNGSVGTWATAITTLPQNTESNTTIEVDFNIERFEEDIAYIIFDYVDDNNYKYVFIKASGTRWGIGYYDGGINSIAQNNADYVSRGDWYRMRVVINGDTVTLSAKERGSGEFDQKVQATFDPAHAIGNGTIGLAVTYAHVQFDNFDIHYDCDGDGYTSEADCDDSNAAINPGMTEVPGNGIDDDCNPDTPDGSCGSFSDDFENGNINGWDGESGTWDFISGTYNGSVDTWANSITTLSQNTESNTTIEVDFNIERFEEDIAYIIFDYVDDNNYKYVFIKASGTRWGIGYYDDGIRSTIAQYDPTDYAEWVVRGDWYRMRVVINGDTVTLSAKERDSGEFDQKVQATFDPAHAIGNGTIGLAVTFAHVQFDNFDIHYDCDGDGYTSEADCDDSNASINPGMTEIPGNGTDDDCNTGTPDTEWTVVSGTWLWNGTESDGHDTTGYMGIITLNGSVTATSMFIESDIYMQTDGYYKNALIIFDYQGPNDFKYARGVPGPDLWQIGYYNGNLNTVGTLSDIIDADRWYRLRVEIDGTTVKLYVDDDRDGSGYEYKTEASFSSIGSGQAGNAVYWSHSLFDNFILGGPIN